MPDSPFCNAPTLSVQRAPRRQRRHLVFLRCGSRPATVIAPALLATPRNWDLALSCYQPPPEGNPLNQAADFLLGGGLAKFHAAKLFLTATGLLGQYATVLFLDDDLELHFDPADFFAYQHAEGLDLAQPSLSHDSFANFRTTLHNPSFHHRQTNFVETMAPSMMGRFLPQVVGQFDRTISGWGLDLLWARALGSKGKAAVVDRFTMRHTRPAEPAGPFYQYLASLGVNALDDLRGVMGELGLERYEIGLVNAVFIRDLIERPPATAIDPPAADPVSA